MAENGSKWQKKKISKLPKRLRHNNKKILAKAP
jgi:hypothetical protein